MAIGQILKLYYINSCFLSVTARKNILVGMLACNICYACLAYGNGGNLSFMLIIGNYTEFVYDFFASNTYQPQKRVRKYKSVPSYNISNLMVLEC
jgi:hypothetical protein